MRLIKMRVNATGEIRTSSSRTVSEFTGILDANQQEIYEGDIVSTSLKPPYDKGVIEMRDCQWQIVYPQNHGYNSLYWHAQNHKLTILKE